MNFYFSYSNFRFYCSKNRNNKLFKIKNLYNNQLKKNQKKVSKGYIQKFDLINGKIAEIRKKSKNNIARFKSWLDMLSQGQYNDFKSQIRLMKEWYNQKKDQSKRFFSMILKSQMILQKLFSLLDELNDENLNQKSISPQEFNYTNCYFLIDIQSWYRDPVDVQIFDDNIELDQETQLYSDDLSLIFRKASYRESVNFSSTDEYFRQSHALPKFYEQSSLKHSGDSVDNTNIIAEILYHKGLQNYIIFDQEIDYQMIVIRQIDSIRKNIMKQPFIIKKFTNKITIIQKRMFVKIIHYCQLVSFKKIQFLKQFNEAIPSYEIFLAKNPQMRKALLCKGICLDLIVFPTNVLQEKFSSLSQLQHFQMNQKQIKIRFFFNELTKIEKKKFISNSELTEVPISNPLF